MEHENHRTTSWSVFDTVESNVERSLKMEELFASATRLPEVVEGEKQHEVICGDATWLELADTDWQPLTLII